MAYHAVNPRKSPRALICKNLFLGGDLFEGAYFKDWQFLQMLTEKTTHFCQSTKLKNHKEAI